MKQLMFLLIISIAISFSCRKNETTNEIEIIALQHCVEKKVSGQTLIVCLDSVISDSRCPASMMCIWEGEATARFSFSEDHQLHIFKLSTHKALPIPNDTTINGYHLRFVDLVPYPGTAQAPVKATVEVNW